jgi:transposase
MKFIEGTPREQLELFATSLEDAIAKDNPVRFIDTYVDQLNLSALGFSISENSTGRPPFRPQLLLKIYIYSYLNKIRTSRRIEKELTRNLELIWLAQSLTPDFHTIAGFRSENHAALRKLFREFLSLCVKLELVSLETVGIDGTKLRAQNNVNNIFRRETVDAVEKKIDEKINEYLTELDAADAARESFVEIKRENIEKRIASLKRQKDKAAAAKAVFNSDASVETVFATDEDCRMMSDKGKIRPGYNAQTAVDAKEKLIVVAEVTNEANDRKQLAPMLEAVQEVKDAYSITEKTTAIADAGYHAAAPIQDYKTSASFDVVVSSPKDSPKPQPQESVPQKEFRTEEFSYSKRKDRFTCPNGKHLPLLTKTTMAGVRVKMYRCTCCVKCKDKARCTRGETGRTITISEHHAAMEAYRKKIKTPAYLKKIKMRKELCEHPFGTIKYTNGIGHFLLRGIEKVRSEFSFTCFIYNLRRSLSIVGVRGLLEAVETEMTMETR